MSENLVIVDWIICGIPFRQGLRYVLSNDLSIQVKVSGKIYALVNHRGKVPKNVARVLHDAGLHRIPGNQRTSALEAEAIGMGLGDHPFPDRTRLQ